MKKLISCLASLALLICLLTGCSASTSDADYQSGYDAGYAAGYKAAQAEQASASSEESVLEESVSSSASSEAEPSSEESQSEETAESEIGTRKNPVPLNTEIQVTVAPSYGGEGIAAFTVSEVVRGQDAEDMLAEANMFNDPAPDGMEYVLAYVTVTFLEDQSGEDDPLKINYFTSRGSPLTMPCRIGVQLSSPSRSSTRRSTRARPIPAGCSSPFRRGILPSTCSSRTSGSR